MMKMLLNNSTPPSQRLEAYLDNVSRLNYTPEDYKAYLTDDKIEKVIYNQKDDTLECNIVGPIDPIFGVSAREVIDKILERRKKGMKIRRR